MNRNQAAISAPLTVTQPSDSLFNLNIGGLSLYFDEIHSIPESDITTLTLCGLPKCTVNKTDLSDALIRLHAQISCNESN
jgi:hypothetical protein